MWLFPEYFCVLEFGVFGPRLVCRPAHSRIVGSPRRRLVSDRRNIAGLLRVGRGPNGEHPDMKTRYAVVMRTHLAFSPELLLSSCLLSKDVKIRIRKTMVLSVVFYLCETWSLTLREEHRLRVYTDTV
jgi:hypothetical protein